MPKKAQNVTRPTDAEIRRYGNVPLAVAASYAGTSSATLRVGLQHGLCPYGWAVPSTHDDGHTSWSYIISPERLIAYQNGSMPNYRIDDIIKMAAHGVDQVISARMEAVQRVCDTLLGDA